MFLTRTATATIDNDDYDEVYGDNSRAGQMRKGRGNIEGGSEKFERPERGDSEKLLG